MKLIHLQEAKQTNHPSNSPDMFMRAFFTAEKGSGSIWWYPNDIAKCYDRDVNLREIDYVYQEGKKYRYNLSGGDEVQGRDPREDIEIFVQNKMWPDQ